VAARVKETNRADQKRTADYRPAEGRVAAPAFRLRSTVPPAFDATSRAAAFLLAVWARLLVFFFALINLPPMARSPISDSLGATESTSYQEKN
jgi:hypothetical protein